MKSPYVLRFGGLSEGRHQLEFELDKTFFLEFGQTELMNAKVKADVELLKRSNGLEIEFELQGNFIFECDRCLEPVDIPIQSEESLYVRFGEHEDFESEIVVLEHNAYEIDLKQLLYEFSILALPMQKVHDYDCSDDQKQEEEKDIETTDPRWEALSKLNWKE